MLDPNTSEESLRHLRNALELEMDRLHIGEMIQQRQAWRRAFSQSGLEETSATAEERPPRGDWRRIVASAVLGYAPRTGGHR